MLHQFEIAQRSKQRLSIIDTLRNRPISSKSSCNLLPLNRQQRSRKKDVVEPTIGFILETPHWQTNEQNEGGFGRAYETDDVTATVAVINHRRNMYAKFEHHRRRPVNRKDSANLRFGAGRTGGGGGGVVVEQRRRNMVIKPSTVFCLLLQTIGFCICIDYHRDGWERASAFLRDAMDQSEEPCVDFFGYACGNWANHSGREASWEILDAQKKLSDKIVLAIQSINLTDAAAAKRDKPLPKYKKHLRQFYDTCMSWANKTEKNLFLPLWTSVHESFQRVKEVREDEALTPEETVWYMIGYFKQTYNSDFLLKINSDYAIRNCVKTPVLKIATPKRIGSTRALAVYQYLTMLHTYFNTGIDNQTLRAASDNTSLLATQYFSEASKVEDESHDDGRLLPLSKLSTQYPNVKWDRLLQGLFPADWLPRWNTSDPLVMVVGEKFLDRISAMIEQYDYDTWESFLYWKLIDQMQEFYKKRSAGNSPNVTPTTEQMTEFCYELMKDYAPAALARLYFDVLKAEIGEWKADVQLVAQNILSAFRIFVSSQDWMDNEDKMMVIERVNEIRIDVDIPSWLTNDTEVEKRTPNLETGVSMVESVHNLKFHTDFRELVADEESYVEHLPKFTAGGVYQNGKIEIFLGQLLPPLYDIQYPLAVKYGMLGWLIGHELLHSFDEASLVEQAKFGKAFLRETVEKIFHQRKQCLVKQYSAYCYRKSNDKCLSGSETVNENIGDIEGLKVAYMAYKFVTQTTESQPPLPELVRLSQDQIFFISAAQLHCGKQYDFFVPDEHPPNNVRVEVSMRNFPLFAKAFRCIKGSKFAPIRTCSLWGRFVSASQCEQLDYELY